jgi:hypothetical protein
MLGRRRFLVGLGAGAVGALPPYSVFAHGFNPHIPGEARTAAKEQVEQFIQPDYAKWDKVRIGMAKAELTDLLGKPLEDEEAELRAKLRKQGLNDAAVREHFRSLGEGIAFGLTYGRIRYTSAVMPDVYEFSILIQEGKVSEKSDPFHGRLSKDGRPTLPDLLLPHENAAFHHFPRFLDFRWSPASGVYPMKYEIEVFVGRHTRNGVVYRRSDSLTAPFPYAATSFGGMNSGRWRVRASNRLGESDWTSFRYFKFNV